MWVIIWLIVWMISGSPTIEPWGIWFWLLMISIFVGWLRKKEAPTQKRYSNY